MPGEQREPAWDFVRRHVRAPAELMADEAPGYNDLVALFPMKRNNHGVAYVVEPGASTNQAESFFSRVRRSAHGVHHRVAGTYLDWYVADLAFREDMRRVRMADLAPRYLVSALAYPVSRNIAGYWQGNKPDRTLGWALTQDGQAALPRHARLQERPNPEPDETPSPRTRRNRIRDAVDAVKAKLKGS